MFENWRGLNFIRFQTVIFDWVQPKNIQFYCDSVGLQGFLGKFAHLIENYWKYKQREGSEKESYFKLENFHSREILLIWKSIVIQRENLFFLMNTEMIHHLLVFFFRLYIKQLLNSSTRDVWFMLRLNSVIFFEVIKL